MLEKAQHKAKWMIFQFKGNSYEEKLKELGMFAKEW